MSEKTDGPRTIQIAPDAKAKVRVYETVTDGEPRTLRDEFEASRNVAVSLLPALTDYAEKIQDRLDKLWVEITLSGKDPANGQDLEMPLYEGAYSDVLTTLRARNISNDEAIMASRSFFQDMFDMVDMKALLLVGIFDKGQASYVLTNHTVEVDNRHMLRLVATTLMQLDKLKAHMAANGFEFPDASKIVTPGTAEFFQTLKRAGG